MDWVTAESEFDSTARARNRILHSVQTGYGTHPVSYPVGSGYRGGGGGEAGE
jgi:hypothetical protein